MSFLSSPANSLGGGARHPHCPDHNFVQLLQILICTRDLAKVLDYSEYRHFLPVIERAKEASRKSGQSLENHFEDILDMVDIGSGAKRSVSDIRLSRYACYLIVQNGDPSKPVIALGQTYFAIQTRKQELQDGNNFQSLSEDERRLMLCFGLKRYTAKSSPPLRNSSKACCKRPLRSLMAVT